MRVTFPSIDRIYLSHHLPIHLNQDRYLILYGGRGGAKSTDTAKKLVIRCLKEKYFKYILCRKTYVSIKDSQYSNIKAVVKEWGLGQLFTFKLSPLEIHCANGNCFIARGLDKEDSTKSIDNPTGIWYEEANQMSEEDFLTSTTSIRTTKADYLQEILTLNPEADGDYENFWLYKRFLSGHSALSFSDNISLPYRDPTSGEDRMISYGYTVIHSTHHANPFLPDDYRAQLEDLVNIDPHYYRVFTQGRWGNRRNDSPFAYAYDPDRHIGFPDLIPEETIYLSFDFNKNPICCSVMQFYEIDDTIQINVLRTIKIPNSSIHELCERIKILYPTGSFMITGDATGRNRSALVKGDIHYYTIIKQELEVSTMQIVVPNINPKMEKNALLINAVLARLRVTIHKTDASDLLYDLVNVRRRPDGTIEKKDRDNPAMQADALDTLRYFCNTFIAPYINL